MSEADIIGYGGSGGGGKTDLAIGKALTQHRRSLIVRKTGTEHSATVDRIAEIFGTRDVIGGNPPVARVSVYGHERTVELIGVPNLGDEQKHRGRPHDLKVFDEATEIPEAQVRFLLAWMRTTIPGLRCQALLCFNPPQTAEGRWVVDFFAPWLDDKHPRPALPGELRYFAMLKDEHGRARETEVADGKPFVVNGETILPQSRTFIPARVGDNPYLAGTNYESTLQALPEPLRSQMLYGDFKAGMNDDPWQVCPTEWVDAAMARWSKPAKLTEMTGLGVDVARGGDDNTVIARKHEPLWFDEPLTYPGKQTPDGPTVAGLVIAAARNAAPVHVDVIGVGSSPYDFLRQAQQQVLGVNVAEGSIETDLSGMLTFKNLRSQLWWRMRESLDPANNTGICLPPDKRLRADLCAPRWKAPSGAIQVESREEIIDRIGRSPDWASAYVLALIPTPNRRKIERAARGVREAQQQGHDPFAIV